MHPSYANSRVSGKFNPRVQRVPSTQLSSFRLSLARYSQSVTRNNTSSGIVVLHRNSIHKSREPITNIPSIRMREEEDAKLYRGRRRENSALETILRWRAQHNAYAPMSSLSMGLTNYPPLWRSLWCDRVQRIMMPMIMWNFWHYILTCASTAGTGTLSLRRGLLSTT